MMTAAAARLDRGITEVAQEFMFSSPFVVGIAVTSNTATSNAKDEHFCSAQAT